MENRKSVKIITAVLALLIGLAAGSALMVRNAPAQEAQKSEAIQLSVNITLAENLTALKGRTVILDLVSGESLSGTVKEVKNGLVYLEKLVGKEFYDALVVIDDISAMELRVKK